MSSTNVRLDLAGKPRAKPLSDRDIPLILITHNQGKLLRHFLAHYRRLGVTRFLCVDDSSTDGTHEFLSAQPDVDLHTSNVRYKAAYRGRLWREMLVGRYGTGRWYVLVDSDEFLIYQGHETAGLRELIDGLARRGVFHLPAPMLDMYPPGQVSHAAMGAGDGQPPWKIATMFDAGDYTLRGDEQSWKIEGGVRHRVFGSSAQLMKYPLIYWGSITNLRKSIHVPAPYWRNFSSPMGVLLHFKFFSDYWADFQNTVANAQHFQDGGIYRDMLRQIEDPDRLVLEGAISAPFVDAADLLARGFFKSWA